MTTIDAARLLGRIRALGRIGRDADGRLTRLAGSDTDREGRDQLVAWMTQAGLETAVDRIGNIFGIWRAGDGSLIMIGSHIDTVIDAGIYDGCYGVLAGLDVIETLKGAGVAPARPIAVAAFTNEEGVRYAPDMMGSLVHAGGLSVEAALATVGTDGSVLGAELERIGMPARRARLPKPHAYLELHVEQGPVLARGRRSARWRICKASRGSESASSAPPIMPAPRRCRCAATPVTRRRAWSRSCATASRPRIHRPSRRSAA